MASGIEQVRDFAVNATFGYFRRYSSERIGRSFAGVKPLQLRRSEWRLEQERRLLEGPEHLGDERDAIAEIRPVDRSGSLQAVGGWIDPIEQFAELGQDDLPK